MKILVVDDDEAVRSGIVTCVRQNGFAADEAGSGAQGIALAHINEYDAVVLDLNLPDMEGSQVCKRMREGKRQSPILMLSVVSDASSKARLLNAGADDYLGKPFSCEELIARLRALFRRRGIIVAQTLRASGITLDPAEHTVRRGRRRILLTLKEFSILEYLMLHAGEVVPKSRLFEHVWDLRSDPFSGAIDTHLCHLRAKLGKPAVIHTLYGRGYRIDL